jgi:hypothetical protein
MTPVLNWTSGGNVLIGTSSQSTGISSNDLLTIGKSGSTSNAIIFSNGVTTNWGYLLAESGKMVLGSGSSSNITFETNSGAERMRITSGGNVGIKTTTPVCTNLVGSMTIVKSYNGDTPTSTTAQTYDINQSNLYLFGRNAGLTLVGNANEESVIAFGNPYAYYVGGIRMGMGSGPAAGDMVFQTCGVCERLRISSNGNIGIGTSSINSKLTIYEGDIRLFKTHIISDTATWKANIFFTDEVDRKGASIVGERTAWDGAPMALGFETGGVNTITRRMTIASTGIVVFNCDISIDNSKKLFFQGCNDPNWFMGVDSTFNTIIAGAGSGARSFILRDITSGNIDRLKINWLTGISCFGGTVCAPCFATISDYRMKSNIRPIEGLSIIMNTKPYKFEYNYDCSTSFGMIAHELQDTLPEAVFGYKDGEVMQGVDYMKLLPITIKAIQEQQCTICSQASMINTLKTCLGIV